jgi:uncharacterized protein (DUF427 family)
MPTGPAGTIRIDDAEGGWDRCRMAVRLRDVLIQGFGELRYEPTAKHVRAALSGENVVDSDRALLVWEPRRIVPYYAVPVDDLSAELVPATAGSGEADDAYVTLAPDGPAGGREPVLVPGSFTVHTTDGDELTVRAGGIDRERAAFRPSDPGLAGYVILDFDAFDAWFEEDERVVAHPRDPFHRIDVLRSSRHVRLELDGQPFAESYRPRLLFETNLPTRFYLPREDVRTELLRPSAKKTACAYKGEASYWSLDLDGRIVPDIAWSYLRPLADGAAVGGMIAFFDERVDVVVDRERRERPVTPWSERGS